MEDLIKSFDSFSISDKNIVQEVIRKSESIDDLVISFQNLTVSEEPIISEECKKVIINLIDVFKILSNKERCICPQNYSSPNWIF